MHGGASTGPRTPEGLERSRKARWVHGRYSREAREKRAAERLAARLKWQPTEEQKERMIRKWEREDRRAARQVNAALRRILGRG